MNKSSDSPDEFAPDELAPGDGATTVAELKRLMAEFVAERRWQPFHTPKNLSMSLAIEAAELMEHFQWLSPDEEARLALDPQRLAQVGEELADVLCYALALANVLPLDLSRAIRDKMAKNRLRYPAAQFRGRYGADDPRPVAAPPEAEGPND